MRNELNDIEKIERYLRNEMSGEEKNAFEKEMQTNPDLKRSVQEQRELIKGMERMKIKSDVSKAKFKFQLKKGLINVGIPVLITAAITALVLNWSSTKPETRNTKPETNKKTEFYELPTLNENGDSLWTDADKYIPYQIYSIDNSRDTIIEGDQGTILAIPANCFVDEYGNAVKGKIDFELKEALNTETILKGGLTTTSNGDLLETGGMFYLNARQDGKSLKVAEGKDIIADVPSDNTKTGMLLFDGERKEDGTINWVNPKPIEKPLVPVDIHTLNFYPPNYEDSLSAMTAKASIKKYKDSVYYSFAGRFGNDKNSNSINNKVVKISDGSRDTVGGATVNENKLNNNASNIYNYSDFVNYYKKLNYERVFDTEENLIPSVGTSKVIILKKNRDLIFILSFDATMNNFSNISLQSVKYNYNISSNRDFTPSFNGLALPPVTTNSKEILFIPIYTRIVENSSFQLSGSCNFQVDFWQNGIVKKFQKSLPVNYFFGGFDLPEDKVSFSGLNPAKVKAIWNDKFQNTLIATKEFEERMPFIHRLCSRGNNVLDIYVKNIDKRISTIDSMVAQTLSGNDRETFLKFASRGEGRVKTDNKLLQKLGKYYDRQTEIFMKAAKKTRGEYYLKNEQKNKTADKKSSIQAKKNIEREAKNFQKEFMINLKDAYHQIGKKPNIVNGRVRLSTGLGWKNLDRYVLEATQTRTSMNYTDPYTGKTAVLEYKPFSVKINEMENYDRVLVYLLPNQLNSFMRMKNDAGVFKENLNMLFKHELVILAYKGDESYFKHYKSIEPGELNDIVLDKMDESKIRTRLFSLNRMTHSEEMQKEVVYQFFLQADSKRRKLFLEKEKFIQRIERVIFPCGN